MKGSKANRFQDLFDDNRYVRLKNHLYNYRIRKAAVTKALGDANPDLLLEVGCGISPLAIPSPRIVFTDVSFSALSRLRRTAPEALYTLADASRLPFRSGSFSHVICSEVLEHLADDRAALSETARVLGPAGTSVITFPHRHFYFACDDYFVHHYRRYELAEMEEQLREVKLEHMLVRKVLGPLEKLTMIVGVNVFSLLSAFTEKRPGRPFPALLESLATVLFRSANLCYSFIARLDGALAPRALSTVLLIKARKA